MAFGSTLPALFRTAAHVWTPTTDLAVAPVRSSPYFFLYIAFIWPATFFTFVSFAMKTVLVRIPLISVPRVFAKSAISNPAFCPQKKFV